MRELIYVLKKMSCLSASHFCFRSSVQRLCKRKVSHFISVDVLSLSFLARHSMEKHKYYTHLDKTKRKTARKFPFSIIRQFTLLTKYLFPRIRFNVFSSIYSLYTVLKLKVVKGKKIFNLG
jgi:hypothetical protein